MRFPLFRFIFLGLGPVLLAAAPPVHAQSPAAQHRQLMRAIERSWNDDNTAATELPLRTLQDYIVAGLDRNPSLKVAFYQWKAAVQHIAQEFSLPDPQFSYTDYIEEVETRVGPQERAYSLRQMFPYPGKLWGRRSKAMEKSEAAYYAFEESRLDLISDVAEAYYEYAYLSKAVVIAGENMKLLQSFESVGQSKYTAGLAKNQDLLKVQVELGKLENELQSLEDMRVPLTRRLISLLHLPSDTDLPWPEESLENLSVDEHLHGVERLMTQLKNDNLRLHALTAAVAGEEAGLALARQEYIPDVTVGVTHIDTGEAINPGMADSGKDPLTVMLTVNVPVWFNRINAGIREAEASLEAARQERASAEEDLLSRLSMVHYQLRDAARQSRLYKDALIPKALQTLNATKSAYESGGMDFISLIDAQRVLLNFQMAYYRHNADFYQRLYEVRALVGDIEHATSSEGEKL